jgi:hypothetical protein
MGYGEDRNERNSPTYFSPQKIVRHRVYLPEAAAVAINSSIPSAKCPQVYCAGVPFSAFAVSLPQLLPTGNSIDLEVGLTWFKSFRYDHIKLLFLYDKDGQILAISCGSV